MSKHGFTEVEINDGQMYSIQFDDIYHNTDGGIAESEYVFLQGNDLPAAWQGRTDYCIAETGFGSGLNFLVALKAWKADPNRSQRLDYFAIEGYPLHVSQLKQIASFWPDLASEADALITQYPPLSHGIHSLSFANGRVQLQLIFNEVLSALNEVSLKPDCWFLDGFAPSKNPQMWRPEVLNALARRSKPDTRLATFTAAGAVRRNLIAAGFDIYRRTGYGRKREMLCAHGLHSDYQAQPQDLNLPWFNPATSTRPVRRAAVIGAGIAGAQTAYHLAQQGIEVCVFETHSELASGASGNVAGIISPKLDARRSEQEDFYLSAFLYQLRQIQSLQAQGAQIDFEQCGLLSIAHTHRKQKRFAQLAERDDLPDSLFQLLSPLQLSNELGEDSPHPGMMIKLAGALSPRSVCRALLSQPNITLRCGQRVQQINPDQSQPGIQLASGEQLEFDVVVLANGYQANEFSGAIELIPVRGQTSCGKLGDSPVITHAIEHEAYALMPPGSSSGLIFGASHIRNEVDTRLQPSETRENAAMLGRQNPELIKRLTHIEDSHAGVRASTEDRWPLLGGLPDQAFYREAYADLHLGKHYQPYPAAQYHPGIYILSGLGSRGLCSAAWCANILTRIICGQTPAASDQALRALHPARFIIRALKKHAP